ncbi:MAG: hypothetical protein Q9M13_04910 [Mariprofundales bacterium]|nr:hypothetical protein [Mariprofundales bacterium]
MTQRSGRSRDELNSYMPFTDIRLLYFFSWMVACVQLWLRRTLTSLLFLGLLAERQDAV